jgi:hypothetical protein
MGGLVGANYASDFFGNIRYASSVNGLAVSARQLWSTTASDMQAHVIRGSGIGITCKRFALDVMTPLSNS